MSTTVVRLIWGSPKRAAAFTVACVVALQWLTSAIPAASDVARWVLAGSPLAVLAAAFPDETRLVAGRLLGRLAGASRSIEREAVKLDLEGTLSVAAMRLTAAWPNGAAAELRLDYLRTDEDVEHLANGTIVVGIASSQNRSRNLVAAAWGWARYAVLRESRPFLDRDVSDGLDFVVARSLLHEVDAGAALEFLTSIWSPAVADRERLREITDKLQRVNEHQLLGPIAITEFMAVVSRMGARFPSTALFSEVADFVDYLYELAIREPGQNVGRRLDFDGEIIRCKVIFVARPDVYSVKGPTPYRNAIEWALREAYHSVYLLAADQNRPYLEDVVAPYRTDPRVLDIGQFPGSYQMRTGRVREQLVVRLAVNVSYHVGIGQRPLVAVGPGPARELAQTKRRTQAAS